MKTRFLCGLFAGLICCSVSQAQQVLSFFAQIPSSTTDWTGTLHLNRFDPGLGTLTQVRLLYAGEVAQSVFAENLDGPNQSYDLFTTASLSLGKTGGPALILPAAINLQKTGTLGVFDGLLDFSGTSGVFFSQNTTLSGVYIDPDLTAYLGVGTVDFNAAALASSILTMHGGNASDGAATTAAASLTVEYTYSPIPEPSTYAALLGLAVFGWVAQRRRSGRETAVQAVA